jgi:hypothetical protein
MFLGLGLRPGRSDLGSSCGSTSTFTSVASYAGPSLFVTGRTKMPTTNGQGSARHGVQPEYPLDLIGGGPLGRKEILSESLRLTK